MRFQALCTVAAGLAALAMPAGAQDVSIAKQDYQIDGGFVLFEKNRQQLYDAVFQFLKEPVAPAGAASGR